MSDPVDIEEGRKLAAELAESPWRFGQDERLMEWCETNLPALLDELEALRAEVKAFRTAVWEGYGPSCEDVCLRSCIGVCDPYREDDDG